VSICPPSGMLRSVVSKRLTDVSQMLTAFIIMGNYQKTAIFNVIELF
jgi:hypothetical protein